ncbi:MAG TPA: hypothetical protein VF365_09390 [Candidatus Limnocylindria bacterium]
MYIAERLHHRIVVVDTAGIMSVAAGTVDADGNGQAGFSGDGGPATEAELNNASSVAVSPGGNLYIADSGNHRVRMVDADGIIATVAGTGERGFAGDGGPATKAQLSWPTGMTFGSDGALYVADTDNHRVRRIDPDGTIATVAGSGEVGVPPDGALAIEAMLGDSDDHVPNGLAIDAAGRLLITDQGNSRIWMIEEGRLRAAAGNGEYASSGDGGPATAAGISGPLDIAVGSDGALYIATHTHGPEGHEVRIVDGRGIIATIAGTGQPGYAGDGGPAARALLNIPSAVAIGPDGDLYIADAVNNRVRKVTLHGE